MRLSGFWFIKLIEKSINSCVNKWFKVLLFEDWSSIFLFETKNKFSRQNEVLFGFVLSDFIRIRKSLFHIFVGIFQRKKHVNPYFVIFEFSLRTLRSLVRFSTCLTWKWIHRSLQSTEMEVHHSQKNKFNALKWV